MTTINKITLKCGRTPGTYDIGGSGGSTPAHDSVGSQEIKDDSIQLEDLNQNVKDAMVMDNDRVTAEDLQGFEV